MASTRHTLSRRTLLKSAGAGAALAPFVPLLEAHGAAAPRRILFFYSSNGTVREKWLPTMSAGQLVLSDILKPLEALKSELLVIDGLGYNVPGWTGHNVGIALTGSAAKFVGANREQVASAKSVDQRIGEVICQGLKFKSLELGIQVDDYAPQVSALSYRGPDDPIRPDSNIYRVFDRVFAGFTAPGPSMADQRRLDRKSVIDLVRRDLTALEPRLGADDRSKVEGHLESIRQIERTLDTGVGGSATASCKVPSKGAALDVWKNDNIPVLGRLAIDTLVMAMACDLTRVGTVQYGRGGAQHRFNWLGPEFLSDPDNGPNDSTKGIHGLAHNESNPTSRAKLARCHTWYAGELAYLMSRLKAIPEGGGTMADSTLVVWMNETGTGNHSLKNTPWVLVGSAGGHFKTGRVLSFPGVAHNKLLVSLCQAMGLPDTTFGVPDLGNGPLTGLT